MKEALKLALEALTNAIAVRNGEGGTKLVSPLEENAITAIKEALAPTSTQCEVQDEQSSSQEPWCMKMNGCKTKCEDCPDEAAKPKRPWGKPWVSLTDEQIWKFWWSRPEVLDGEDDSMEAEFVAAVRRVLAAHGIKENT